MGSTDSIPQNNSHRLNREIWQPQSLAPNQSTHPEYGSCVRLRNNMTGEELDEYEHTFNNIDEYSKYMEIRKFRNQHEYLVPIAYINQQKIKHVCSHIYHLKIYIEHIPLRLCNIKDIPFPENLYVMMRILKGLKILFDQVGHFNVTQDLLCISEEGIAKVWLNADLSKDFAQNSHGEIHYNRFRRQLDNNDENSMVWEVIMLIDQLTNKQSIPPNGYSLIQYLKTLRKSHLDFCQAIDLVSKYAQQMHTDIPEVFYSAIKIIREKKGIFQSEADVTLNNRIIQDDLESVIRKGRFKQSQVERVPDFKYNSGRSYVVSQSNYTYADKLKKFDNPVKNTFNVFGRLSGIKDTPIKKTSTFKQPNTDRAAANLLSYSEISSPPGTQSLTMISPLMHPSVVHISSSNSQIISNSKSICVVNELQSPVKQQQKPQTYFSQYIQQDQNNFIKRQKQFSFGQQDGLPVLSSSQSRNNLLKNIPVVQSMINSKTEVRVFSCNKPIVTFTYSQNPSLNSSVISNDNKLNLIFQASMPISPPSIDRSLLSKMVDSIKRAENKQLQANNQPEKNRKYQQLNLQANYQVTPKELKNKAMKPLLKLTKQVQIKIKPTFNEQKTTEKHENVSQNYVKSNIQAKQTMQDEQKMDFTEKEEKNKSNKYAQNPQKIMMQNNHDFDDPLPTIYKNRPRMLSEKIKRQSEPVEKQIPALSQSQTPILKLNFKQQLALLLDQSGKRSNDTKKKEVDQKQLIRFLQANSQLKLDPQIAADLMVYQSKQKQKYKQAHKQEYNK